MKPLIVWIALLLAGCAGESPEDTLAKLDSLRREAYADIARQMGECNAVAIEFKGDPLMVRNCQDTYRLVVASSQQTIADVNKRMAEIHRADCAAITARVKSKGGGFIPLDCENKPVVRYLTDEEVFGKKP